MYVDDTMPVRIPKKVFGILAKLKAKRMQATGKQLSNGELIAQSVEESYMNALKKPERSIMELDGFIKGGARSNATEEIDEVVYGGDPNG